MIDIIAPASRCPLDELNAGIKELESWGYRVRVPNKIFGDHWTHSHENEERFLQLKNALYAQDSSAVWCVRGGYGSLKLLPQLAKLKPPSQVKLFLGLSDITSLHLFLNQKWKWPTLHSPIVSRIGRGDLPVSTIIELQNIICGKQSEVLFKVKPLNDAAKNFKGEGIIVGGNFTTLQTTLGTPFQWQPKNSILFLEDVGERAYRLDRIWEHFKQAGLLNKAKAIVLGDFTDGHEKNGVDLIPKFIKERVQEISVPVYGGLPVGHGPIQRVLPLGVSVQLNSKKLIIHVK